MLSNGIYFFHISHLHYTSIEPVHYHQKDFHQTPISLTLVINAIFVPK